ncbi:MAG TPA: PHB depolymerase family esterase [Stellaceae bacterium]|nr:PHB depolymerase family esterase [Stellaceae bacterium]
MPRRLLTLMTLLTPMAVAGAGEATYQQGVVFDQYPNWSSRAELVRRLASPLDARRVLREASAAGRGPGGQTIDLANERFVLRVPVDAPPAGYALLVFISPWQDAKLPSRWAPALDHHGMIFVSAANTGNAAGDLDRREPLALIAAANVMKRYRVDPDHVYIGGFSGGARVAMRLALGYPDVFRGALLNAGSDPIGDEVPPPPADLFRRFQDSTRLIYMTGAHDDFHLAADGSSRHSMETWCVFDLDTETAPRIGHEPADPATLDDALDALATHRPADHDRLAACRARVAGEMSEQLKAVQDLLAGGRSADALTLLKTVDRRYGGLAAPQSLDLADRLEVPR